MRQIYSLPGSGLTSPIFPYSFGRASLDSISFENHTHDYSEIVIITGGEGIHSTEIGDYPVISGDVYLIHPGVSHGFRDCRRLEMINLAYGEECLLPGQFSAIPGFQALFVLEPLYRKQHNFTNRLHLTHLQKEAIEKDCRRLEREFREREPGFETVYEGLFRALAVELCRYYMENARPGDVREGREDLIRLGTALSVMEQRFAEDLSLKDLARMSGYSVNHFSRLCEKVYSLPPLQYILQQRLSLAVSLLRETELTITEISGRVGYDDPNYFSRLFRKKMGVSPREYRQGR